MGLALSCFIVIASIRRRRFNVSSSYGARSLTSDAHYAGLGAVTGDWRVDKALGEAISLMVFSPNMDEYAKPHNEKHHGLGGVVSASDLDVGIMRLGGFRTGASKAENWRRLRLRVMSPRFHGVYALNRLNRARLADPDWAALRHKRAFAVSGRASAA